MNLSELIAPLAPDEFFAEYWERKPLLARGAAGRFSSLFSTRDLGALLQYGRPELPGGMLLVKGSRHFDRRWISADGTARLEDVRAAWREGYSIVINNVGKLWEPIARFTTALTADLHHPTDMNLYMTPAGTQAFDPHFDVMDVFVMQVEGSKVWQVRGAAVELPYDDEHTPLGPDQLPPVVLEDELRSGDVLYIPRGFVHSARATSEASVHLTTGVFAITWRDLVTAAVASIRDDVRLRRSLPAGFLAGSDGMAAAFRALLDDLPARASFEQAIGRLAETHVVGHPVPPREELLANDTEIDLDTVLTRREGVLCRATEGPHYALIQYSGGKIVGPRKIAPALIDIANRQTLSARSLAGDLNDSEKLVLARRLVREGILTHDAR